MIFDIFSRKPSRYLGIDIGTSTIKLVELVREKEIIRLENYGILKGQAGYSGVDEAIQARSFGMMDQQVAEMVKVLLAAAKVKTKQVIMSAPVFSCFVTLMEFPNMSEKEIGRAMSFEARQYIPIPIHEVELDWMIIGRTAGPLPGKAGAYEKIQVLAIAIPKETVTRLKKISFYAGLELKAIEFETLAIIRSVIGSDSTPQILVDMGARSTSLAVVEGGFLKMAYSIDTAGTDLSRAIANGLKIGLSRAEEIKKARGLTVLPGEEDIRNLMITHLDVIGVEIERIAASYLNKTGTDIKKVVLVGGSSNLPGLIQYYGQRLRREVKKGNPFANISYLPVLEPIIPELASMFPVTVGLAMRELMPSPK